MSTPNSRFDRHLRGEKTSLTAEELEGYRLFKDYGCASCHQGLNVGGNLFQKFGIMADYFAERGRITKADYGQFNVTNKEDDRYVFKVPSLRNIALTAPYFHDGSAATLEDAVNIKVAYRRGILFSGTKQLAALFSNRFRARGGTATRRKQRTPVTARKRDY